MGWQATGVDDLLNHLASLKGDGLAMKIAKAGAEHSLEPVLAAEQQLTPVLTGRLRDSEKITKAKVKKGVIYAQVRVSSGDTTDKKDATKVASGGVSYATPVIYGYKDHAGITHPPNNFPARAAEAHRQEVIDRFSQYLSDVIDATMLS